MGGAVSADVSDFSACYYNPAGLALAHGLEISVGYFRADQSLYMNGKNSGVDPVKGMVGGAVVPGKVFDVPFAFGVGFHIPDNWLTRVRALPQDQPRWELYDNRNQRLWFGVDLAISPFPWLQLGGGVTFMAATKATLDISGHIDLFGPTDSSLRHQVDADLTIDRLPGVRRAHRGDEGPGLRPRLPRAVLDGPERRGQRQRGRGPREGGGPDDAGTRAADGHGRRLPSAAGGRRHLVEGQPTTSTRTSTSPGSTGARTSRPSRASRRS